MDTIDLIVRSKNGDKEAREKVITENIGLVWSIVKRFMGRGCEAEDLFQIGCIGLMKAVDKFDISYDVKLSTYAVPMIAGEIKRFLRDDSMVKISRVLKENGLKAKIATERMSCLLGREPTLEEVAEEAGLTCEDVVLAMEAGAEVESLYKSVYQSDGSEIYLVDKVAGNGEGRVVGGDGFYDVREDKEKEKLFYRTIESKGRIFRKGRKNIVAS